MTDMRYTDENLRWFHHANLPVQSLVHVHAPDLEEDQGQDLDQLRDHVVGHAQGLDLDRDQETEDALVKDEEHQDPDQSLDRQSKLQILEN